MAELAENTGGAYITASDRLKKPLQQLIEDMTTYYEASYVPPIQEYDGKFRPVAVTAGAQGAEDTLPGRLFCRPSRRGLWNQALRSAAAEALERTATACRLEVPLRRLTPRRFAHRQRELLW